jgi:hypothetical protein
MVHGTIEAGGGSMSVMKKEVCDREITDLFL